MSLVSIIMPVRNAIPYLEECLESIIGQSHSEWELLAVNDGTTDTSYELLKEYASKDKRIKCFQNGGSGIIDALNTGYTFSKGQFITRMDADDVMPSAKLEHLVESLVRMGEGHVATGKVKYISTTELGDGFKKYEAWLNALCDENNHYQDIYKECVIPSPCWMMHRSDFERIGGFASQSYPEDYDLCFRMYEHGISVLPSREILHIWRDHGDRASRNDDNYTDNRFLDLKVKYFLRNDHFSDRNTILWGAGKKGKYIAQLLLKYGVEFEWITNNEKKRGKHIYGHLIHDVSILQSMEENLSIILAVANQAEQNDIIKFVDLLEQDKKVHLFC